MARHSAKGSLPSAVLGTRQIKFFFLVFSSHIFCVTLIQDLQLSFRIWLNFKLFCYISLIIFVSLNISDASKFELQVHEILESGHSKNVIHDVWRMLRPYPGSRVNLRACWCRNMTSYMQEMCF